jgi:hypothetical protein
MDDAMWQLACNDEWLDEVSEVLDWAEGRIIDGCSTVLSAYLISLARMHRAGVPVADRHRGAARRLVRRYEDGVRCPLETPTMHIARACLALLNGDRNGALKEFAKADRSTRETRFTVMLLWTYRAMELTLDGAEQRDAAARRDQLSTALWQCPPVTTRAVLAGEWPDPVPPEAADSPP